MRSTVRAFPDVAGCWAAERGAQDARRKRAFRNAGEQQMRRHRCMPILLRTDVSLSRSAEKNKTLEKNLTWRPPEIAAAEQMQVQMEYGLAGALTAVHNGSVPIEKIPLAGELRGYKLQFPQDRLIFGRGVGQRFEMLARTNQDVRGSLWVDVFESKKIGIFVHDFRGDLLRGDLAEQAVRAHWVPLAGVPSSSRRTIGVNPSRSRSCSPNWRAASSPETLPTRTR